MSKAGIKADETAASYVGVRFGRWTVTGVGINRPGTSNRVRAKCDCGRADMVELGNLCSGYSTQCRRCGWNDMADARRVYPKTRKPCQDCGAELSKVAWSLNNQRCRSCCNKRRLNTSRKYPVSIGAIARACGITRQAVSLRVQRYGFGPALAMYTKEHGPIAPAKRRTA